MGLLNKLFDRDENAVDAAISSLNFKELSVDEINSCIQKMQQDFQLYTLNLIFPNRLPLVFVSKIIDQNESFFKSIRPSEYGRLLKKAEKANPKAVKIWRKLNALAKRKLPAMEKKESAQNGR